MTRWWGPIGASAVVVVLAFGGCGSGEDKTVTETRTVATEKGSPEASVVDGFVLEPPAGAPPGFGDATGRGNVALRGGDYQLVVQADLVPNRAGEAYEVWLYNSPSDAKSVGAQVTGRSGRFIGAGKLPDDYLHDYRYVDISLEKVDQNRRHSGRSVLRGKPGP